MVRSEISFPSKLIEPLSIGCVPTIELNNVVLPEPLGPIIPTIDPCATCKEISTLAFTPPKDFETLLTSNNAINLN